MAKVESAPLYMTNQKQAHFFSLSLSLSCLGGFIIRIYCFSLLQYGFGAELSFPETAILRF